MQQHTYSQTWFDTFLHTLPEARTEAEVDFLMEQLPVKTHSQVLDIACGTGRHANRLANRGYEVVGIDREEALIAEARRNAPTNAHYQVLDMHELDDLGLTFDAALSLWQSFGADDRDTSQDFLEQVHAILRTDGRFVLDAYNPAFFEAHQGEYVFEKDGRTITETKHIKDGRLHVALDYGNGEEDHFIWTLYTPDAMRSLMDNIGFECLLTCTNYDASHTPRVSVPRVQYVFVRR
jgi:cyclopropane fatty-acyl-phospholipid synthase-like methyltransferase